MECKNCNYSLTENAQFCDHCGAKVVKSRITLKEMISLFFEDVFGVDSRFFRTLKEMAIHPNKVLEEYLTGVRKRYVNPFAFLAIAVGISLIVFKYFEDDFLRVNSEFNKETIAALKKDANLDLAKYKDKPAEELKKLQVKKQSASLQLKFMDGYMKFMLNYYNLIMFIFLPFYALLSKWTYPKPHNFGEHIVMNAYIVSFTTLGTLLFFGFSFLNPKIYTYSFLFTILFYLFAFGKLYQKKFVAKLFKASKIFSRITNYFYNCYNYTINCRYCCRYVRMDKNVINYPLNFKGKCTTVLVS
ncbi:MAG: DUF3667 domain-containing protein [Polaribacter sp.]|nr:DUF3667 domain-containing protein [Polaribacter sp.]